MKSFLKPPNYHPAGESEDEEFDEYGVEDQQKPREYHRESPIDYESQFHKEISAGNVKGMQTAFNDGALLKVVDNIYSSRYNGLMTACSLGHWDIVAYLLEVGANPNFNNVDLFTPLMAVSFSFSTDDDNLSRCARLLFEKGAHLNAVDTSATTPLMYACKFGHVGLVQELLKMGANTNIQDNQGWTALFWAVNKGNVESVQMLLKAGAKKKLKDKNKKTAYSFALSKKGTEKILAVLNPKKYGKKTVVYKGVNDVIDDGLADWMARFDRFVPIETTPKDKGMKLNLFQFLTATEDDLITLGMKYFWQRKQTLMFIKYYHLQPWVKFKAAEKRIKKGVLACEESPLLTYTLAANQILALHSRLVIIQASAVFLQRQCEYEDMQDDVRMAQLARMFTFGLHDMVNELQNILQSLDKTDKSLVYPADFIKPLQSKGGKSKRLTYLTLSAVACLGALAFWKPRAIFGTSH